MSESDHFPLDPSLASVEETQASTETISADEIDRLLESLCALMETSSSATVREILEAACCDLAELLPMEEDEDVFDEAA